MISYYKPYRAVFAADMLFATLSAAVALTIPLVVRYVTSTLIYQQPQMMLRKLFLIGIGLFVLLALDCYSRFFIGNYGHVMGAKMEYDMRAELFGHLQKLSFSFYDDAKVGQLMSRVTADLFDITELLHHGPENIILSVLKIVGAFVILLNINGWLALAAFAVLPVMFVFAFVLNKRMRRAFQQNRIKIAEINEQIEDNLSGIRVVKSFANEAIENEKFRHGNDGFLAAKKNSYHYMGSFQAGVGVFTTLIQVNVILAGGVLIAKGMVTVNDLVTFLLYIGVFTDPIRTLVDFTEQFQNGYTGFERFQEIMNIEPEIQDANDAVALTDVKGTIDFENVSFQYKDNQEKVLNRINLHVPAGAYMALVGSSGAGKTTLCSLIPRFYDPQEGTVKVNGINAKDYPQGELCSEIGVVQQRSILFKGSIRDNLKWGNDQASDEDLWKAITIAQAKDVVEAKPGKLDSEVEQNGRNLSGGQKQRLTIARALVSKPEILILDDSLSALDFATDAALRKAIGELEGNVTTFLVSQRISGIRQADKILVMEDGELAGQGTHEELMETCETYQEIYYSQFPEERPAAVKSSKETGKDLDKADKMTEKAEKGAAE